MLPITGGMLLSIEHTKAEGLQGRSPAGGGQDENFRVTVGCDSGLCHGSSSMDCAC